MVAGILRILGRDMGANLDPNNNEDLEFLTHGGDRRVFSDPNFATQKSEYIDRIAKYIDTRNASTNAWGWKDPLASYYIEDVFHTLKTPAIVFVTRDPVAIAIRETVEALQGAAVTLASMLNATAEYTRVIHFLTDPKTSALLVSYERALRQPAELVTSLRNFICAPQNEEAERRATEFVQPDRGSAGIVTG